MNRTVPFILLLLAAPHLQAAIQSREVTYQHEGVTMQGFVAWDDATAAKRPGVLVVHEWWGHNQHARNQATRLAEAGYVGLAVDMYGVGKVATHPEDATKFMTEAMSNPEVMKARFLAAKSLLAADPHVDAERIGAIGYCFGGAVVLGMARQGVDLDVVGTFHGSLATGQKAAPGAIKPRIIVLHGSEDTMVNPQVDGFRAEMTAAGANFEIVVLEGAKHSFTNPDADAVGMAALGYSAEADRESWRRWLATAREAFGE
jgi:dienelactone hydrolase